MLNIPNQHYKLLRQFIKFGITGGIGAMVDFGIYFILTRLVGWNTSFTVWGETIIAANMVSVFIAIVSNYLINRWWTFRDRKGNAWEQWVKYFGLNLVTWALNQIVTSFFIFHVPLLQNLFGDRRDFVAKALAIGLILFVNFGGSKMLVFRQKSVAVSIQ